MEKHRLVCSAADRDGLQEMINQYYFSTNWVILDDMRIYNTKTGKYANGIVTNKRNRWRYEI